MCVIVESMAVALVLLVFSRSLIDLPLMGVEHQYSVVLRFLFGLWATPFGRTVLIKVETVGVTFC